LVDLPTPLETANRLEGLLQEAAVSPLYKDPICASGGQEVRVRSIGDRAPDSVASTAASPVGALIVPDGGYRIDNPQLILVAGIMRIFA
jgi:hypothetical protein